MSFKQLDSIKKQKLEISGTLAKKVVGHLFKKNRDLVQDAIKEVEKPKPYFDYIWLFPLMMTRFCELKGYDKEYITGVSIGGKRKSEQTLFIAILLKLYSEAVFKEIYDVENGVRYNIAGMLDCNEHGVSQAIPLIIGYMKTYDEFSSQVNQYSALLKEEFKDKKAKDEEPTEPPISLFE